MTAKAPIALRALPQQSWGRLVETVPSTSDTQWVETAFSVLLREVHRLGLPQLVGEVPEGRWGPFGPYVITRLQGRKIAAAGLGHQLRVRRSRSACCLSFPLRPRSSRAARMAACCGDRLMPSTALIFVYHSRPSTIVDLGGAFSGLVGGIGMDRLYHKRLKH